MPRLEVDVDEEVMEGLTWAAGYFQLSLDKTANMFLLTTLAEFAKRIAVQMAQE
jgi:hypothetical protein